MPAKFPVRGGVARSALLLCILFLFFGPTMAPALAQHVERTASRLTAVVLSSTETSAIVTTSADLADGNTTSLENLNSHPGPDGAISLREAILATNSMTDTAALTIAFDLPTSDPGYNSANSTWTIAMGAHALPALSHGNLTIDGTTQPGTSSYPRIILDGFDVFESPGQSNGITLTSQDNTIRGLTLVNFYDDAVLISGANAAFNQIAGCYLGLDSNGATATQPSDSGVDLRDGAHDNIIGGGALDASNLISGNVNAGVLIQGIATHNNTVAGNRIGVTPSGQAALANAIAGVMVKDSAHDNQIGGANQGNLIASNDTGIYLDGGIATTITGNTIGLAADNTTPLGNINNGILMVRGAHDNIVGGTSPALRNIVSGNGVSTSAYGQGIYLSDANTNNNTIQGNYIGVDASGNQPAGNYRQGILIGPGAQNNTIGGTVVGAGNVIAYNGMGGIRVDAPANQIAGNLIGVGADGTTQLGNQLNGVRIVGDSNTVGPSNLIAYNQQSGIWLGGSATTVMSNTLLSNALSGICVTGPNSSIHGNTIDTNGGGDGPWAECAIRGGVVITGTTGTWVSDNHILSNSDAGVTIYSGAGNRILSNSISGNGASGIELLNGGNNGIAPPHLDSVTTSLVSGSACALCLVELFTDTGDEGHTFIGATTAASNGAFTQAISQAPPGTYFTATHTDSHGNTSSFAAAVSVQTSGEVQPTPTPFPTRPSLLPLKQFVPMINR